jgi:colicin import membrane protein
MTDEQNQAISSKLSEQQSFLKSLLDPQGYGLAIIVALTLHIVVITLFSIEWPEEKRRIAEPTPKNIQAKVIQVENKEVKKRQQADQKRLAKKKRDAKRRKETERKKKLAASKAKKDKAARDKSAKAKLAKDKADKARKDKAEKDKLAAEKVKKLALEQEKEDELFEQQQEQELLNALAVEEQQRSMDKALAEEQRARQNAAITNTTVAQIQAKIYEVWSYPPSARPDMEVIVRINLVPTGEVIQVVLEKSSGNQALDRSVLAAVKRAQPLPVPKDSRLFEQQFRNFVMSFRPEDAVW